MPKHINKSEQKKTNHAEFRASTIAHALYFPCRSRTNTHIYLYIFKSDSQCQVNAQGMSRLTKYRQIESKEALPIELAIGRTRLIELIASSTVIVLFNEGDQYSDEYAFLSRFPLAFASRRLPTLRHRQRTISYEN
jgi:hypothetical protein